MSAVITELTTQLALAFSPWMLWVCLIGVTLGILWGAMPGLSTTMAMALLIGLSTGMTQHVAVMFMLGVYTGSVFGGAISAVLINIPGTPDAVPTMIEGHPLAQRGEGGLALGTAIAASFLGNWVGIVLLIAFIPAILFLALQFRSWEMFLLAMWGIAICGSMASGDMPLKGWISGWIGLLISFVGLDAIHGVARFTFGFRILEDRISYIPLLIGLFGLTEILKVLPQKNPPGIPSDVGRVVPPFSMLWKYARTSLRSGLIGTIIGAIPGAGANVASFLSYDIARRRAPPEERAKWGKGSYEAIVSAEVANNANIGGSMLPTLTLGIPGNAAAAAILAALEMKNIVVGPTIQTENPGIIYFIYIGLIIANFLMYFMAIGLIKPCVKLFSLPRTLLMPLIIPICVMGAFAVSLSYFDVYIMFIAGIAGYILHRFGFPLAPMVLAVILGPLADENLRRALLVFEDRNMLSILIERPLGTVLLLVVIYTFYDGIFRRGK
ncbi:MAG: tripartite tricarboxylate transporter permease [Rhodospirillales bacterium]|jgi:putative tricarboxylic transport membrane protein|nr:transporter [Rhodospirillaceae bacterium]MDP6428639.1 tripartite tricarboxylate transporter permease [Rhodospirillales bacterium]MDP6645052.1 tripartite tricarboxylate transporter permease [Rhodospirillales bacterium]MDP6842252.1 tripartite tricarboxylate transporter permease [Rhodospirillales bacterium]